jgi:hypothetical protein
MTIKTVGDLKEALEEFDDALPVRIAYQPSWPLAGSIQNVREVDRADEPGGPTRPGDVTLWIAVDQVSTYTENPYAPRDAWDEE